ncbi:uncharacterized protein LOC100853941 [Vitis vinifera]|uniref:Uncharacterized protein n=1 Tax=Vitis vinifera TaxID=29760 RepID=F6HC47_VITVI|nr:uncharacterized protein LOC100853941 [Vitis vinifera]|eukprot:XP_003633432.1 PREDICTED: uncharacterized protein LOC100853941 [Vitis vinifera]
MSQSHIVSALILLLILLPCFHSARLLNDFPAAATHLALPTDELHLPPEKHSGALPCEMGPNNNYPGPHRLPRKYRPLYLNHVLPKGTTPPSGPSKGINDVKN